MPYVEFLSRHYINDHLYERGERAWLGDEIALTVGMIDLTAEAKAAALEPEPSAEPEEASQPEEAEVTDPNVPAFLDHRKDEPAPQGSGKIQTKA